MPRCKTVSTYLEHSLGQFLELFMRLVIRHWNQSVNRSETQDVRDIFLYNMKILHDIRGPSKVSFAASFKLCKLSCVQSECSRVERGSEEGGVRAYALRIVFMDKILRFTNTLIFIISLHIL